MLSKKIYELPQLSLVPPQLLLGLLEFLIRPLKRRLRSVALNSDQRDMACPLDQLQIARAGTARLRVVHGESTKYVTIFRNKRLGPGSTQSVTHREISIVGYIK